MALTKLDKAERFIDRIMSTLMRSIPAHSDVTNIYGYYAFSEIAQSPDMASFTFTAVAGCPHRRIVGNGWISDWDKWANEEWDKVHFTVFSSATGEYIIGTGQIIDDEVILTGQAPVAANAS